MWPSGRMKISCSAYLPLRPVKATHTYTSETSSRSKRWASLAHAVASLASKNTAFTDPPPDGAAAVDPRVAPPALVGPGAISGSGVAVVDGSGSGAAPHFVASAMKGAHHGVAGAEAVGEVSRGPWSVRRATMPLAASTVPHAT